jgi:tetratricopeptide (TPR) repeat protein
LGPADGRRRHQDAPSQVRGSGTGRSRGALARLGRRDEALAELNSAVRIADELVGRPLRWHAQAALGRAAYALGDDDRATRGYGEALRLVEEFSSALAPERAAQLAKAPLVEEIRSAAR